MQDDDPPELRRLLSGSPAVVAERALRLAWTVSQDQVDSREELRRVGSRVEHLVNAFGGVKSELGEVKDKVHGLGLESDERHGQTMGAFARLFERLGIVEKAKADRAELPSGSLRPISYHDLPDAIAKVEAKQSDERWLGVRDFLTSTFKEGIKRGAVITVASIVAAVAIFAAGMAYRDCAHAVVKTGTSNEIPKIHQVEP
jgi:hypothetical protein